MSTWQPLKDQYWMKSVGASGWVLEEDWLDHEENESKVIRFSNRTPASIQTDDPLLYYAAGHMKLFGIVTVFTKPVRDDALAQWPWAAPVRSKVIIRNLDRAPSLDILTDVDPNTDWRKFVQQMDYHAISEDVFDFAAAALLATADESHGDIIDPTFAAKYRSDAQVWEEKHVAPHD